MGFPSRNAASVAGRLWEGTMSSATPSVADKPQTKHMLYATKRPPGVIPGGLEIWLNTLWEAKLLLQSLFDSNSHGNGHTDHGVVTSAQEAHHFHVKSACRRLFACGAGTFGAGSPAFHKIRSTSQESSMLCFPSMGTSYHIDCSRNKTFELN